MKVHKLICPECAHSQSIDSKYAGQQFACPKCSKAASVQEDESLPPPPTSIPAVHTLATDAKSALANLYTTSKSNPLFITVIIDVLLDKLRGLLKVDSFFTQARICARLGHYMTLLVAVGCIPFGIVLAIRMESWQLALAGPILTLGVFFLQYMAAKFLELASNMREGSEVYVSSKVFFDVSAALCLMFAFLGLAIMLISLFSPDMRFFLPFMNSEWLVVGLGITALFLYFSCYLYLHPEELLNARSNPRITGGETYLSLLAVSVRAILPLLPFIYGLGCLVAGGRALYYGVGSLFSEDAQYSLQSLGSSMGAFCLALLSPLILYFLVLFFYFLLDLILAVFRIARNTEK